MENCHQYESVSKVGQLAGGSKDTECKTVRRETEECTLAPQHYISHEE